MNPVSNQSSSINNFNVSTASKSVNYEGKIYTQLPSMGTLARISALAALALVSVVSLALEA